MIHTLTQWFTYNYVPHGQPFWTGAVWPNAFVLLVLAPLGWAWSRTKYWPLALIHAKLDALHAKHDALHARHDQHAQALAQVAERVEALHQRLDG